MADVKFLFKREGRVKVALGAGEDIEARLEKLVDVALDADAEDFEAEDQEDGTRHIEVCSACCILRPTDVNHSNSSSARSHPCTNSRLPSAQRARGVSC